MRVKRGQDEAQATQLGVPPPVAGFKAKVALEAISGQKTTNEIAAEFGVHTTQTCPAVRRIGHWKKQVLESLPEIFANNRGRSRDEDAALRDRLYQQIGQLQVELEWLKKRVDIPPEVIRSLVRDAGYETDEAENGRAGLEKIAARKPHCILTDLLMPDMGGLELLESLRELGAAIPVIIITANIQESVRQRCLELGAAAVVNKPVRQEELHPAIEKALGDTVV